MEIIELREHENLISALEGWDRLSEPDLLKSHPRQPAEKPYLFDLDHNGNVGYFIGLDWILEGKMALEVSPKIEGLDFMAMFSTCLQSSVCRPHVGKIYHIDWNKAPIPSQRHRHDLTTIVAIHFLVLLVDLIQKPLKKGYVVREENLRSRVKGKVHVSRHLQKNILGMRPDQVYCVYQEYSEDCLENRLLHSGLVAAKRFLQVQRYRLPDELVRGIVRAEQRLENIGLVASPAELDRVRLHPLFPEYAEALKLAKMLHRKFGYRAQSDTESRVSVPPFVVDMSLLFELYCLHHLTKADGFSPTYQFTVNSGICDFLDVRRRTILDAKYKPYYDRARTPLIDDIRQLSGYARDNKVFAHFALDEETTLPCVVIYPSPEAGTDLIDWHREPRLTRMKGYRQFFKVGLRLPMLEGMFALGGGNAFTDIEDEIEGRAMGPREMVQVK